MKIKLDEKARFFLAAKIGPAEEVLEAIAKNPSWGMERNPQRTALMHAALRGQVDSVKTLLPHSDALARSRPEGYSALFLAVTGTSTALGDAMECVRVLLPASDPRAASEKGETPLMAAIAAKSADCVAMLLPLSDVAATNKRGETALDLALREKGWECLDQVATFLGDEASLARAMKKATKSAGAQLPRTKAAWERLALQKEMPDSSDKSAVSASKPARRL